METMAVTILNRLLDLDDIEKDELNSINSSAFGAPDDCRKIHVKHPVYGMICDNPVAITPHDSNIVIHDSTVDSRDRYQVGNIITTSGVPAADLSSSMDIESLSGRTSLRFDGNRDYSNMV